MSFSGLSKSRSFFILLLIATLPLLSACNSEARQSDMESESNVELTVTAEKLLSGIRIGWGMDWLPNGDLLVTEKGGTLYLIRDWEIAAEIGGLPEDMTVNGQGGFLDVKVHPNYEENGWIYFTFASTMGDEEGSNTAFIRARIEDNTLTDIERLYKASPNSTRGAHYGSRIEFDNEGYVYFSVGDRGNRDVNPQDINRDMGKIYRLNDDGSIPSDNPFVGKEGLDAVYSYGHRNPQGMDRHPETGAIWENEHGPRGGDEINIIEAGKNYGWPVISYGINYDGTEFTQDTAKAGMEQPVHYWDPSIAPAGMAFISSDDKYPGWKGDLLVASLKFAYIAHLDIEGNEVVGEEKLVEGVGRVRAVEEGPDGYIYFTAEGDGIYRLVPSTE